VSGWVHVSLGYPWIETGT